MIITKTSYDVTITVQMPKGCLVEAFQIKFYTVADQKVMDLIEHLNRAAEEWERINVRNGETK